MPLPRPGFSQPGIAFAGPGFVDAHSGSLPRPTFTKGSSNGTRRRRRSPAGSTVSLDELVEYRLARKSSPLGWLFGRRTAGPPRGLYLFGAVGGGKTMLMDLFFEAAPARRKRRVHFHAFMADVHARIHDWRQKLKQGLVKGDDPIAPIAAALAAEAWLLCFDEFSVSDIADAMILGRLFQAMFAAGVVVVATSNVAPERLYEGGLNRALFLPFIGLLGQRMDVVELASRTDFRLEKLAGAPVYHVPADAQARAALGHAFKALTGVARGAPLVLPVLGRELVVPEAAANVARFSFAELCERPLAAVDYLVIAERFHTLLIDAIPVLRAIPAQRGQALHHPDRCALRSAREADRFGSGRAAGSLPWTRRTRSLRVRAHRLAVDRDAFAGLSRFAAWGGDIGSLRRYERAGRNLKRPIRVEPVPAEGRRADRGSGRCGLWRRAGFDAEVLLQMTKFVICNPWPGPVLATGKAPRQFDISDA